MYFADLILMSRNILFKMLLRTGGNIDMASNSSLQTWLKTSFFDIKILAINTLMEKDRKNSINKYDQEHEGHLLQTTHTQLLSVIKP